MNKQKLYLKYTKLFEDNNCHILTSYEEFTELASKAKRSKDISVKYIATCCHENVITIDGFRDQKLGRLCKSCLIYERYKNILIENKCHIETSSLEFKELLKHCKPNEIYIKFIATCNHIHTVRIDSFKQGFGTLCKNCNDIKNNNSEDDGSSKTSNLEDKGIVHITDILKNDFEIKLTDDGCLADFAIRNKNTNDDLWIQVQLKTTNVENKQSYFFNTANNYKNCIILCMHILEKKYWIYNGNDIDVVGIRVYKGGKYDKEVKEDQLRVEILKYMDILTYLPFEKINIPISDTVKKEQKFRIHRENKCNFLQFDYSNRTSLVYDFKINGFKVQEKLVKQENDHRYVVNLHKSGKNGKNSKRPYEKGDNDFYWLHFPDLHKFMIIPEQILIEHEHIKTDYQDGKVSLHINLNYVIQTEHYLYYCLFNYDNCDTEKIKKIFTNAD